MDNIDLKTLKILPYARKSKIDKEDKKILSLEGQIKEINRYAERYNLKFLPIIEENASAYSIGRVGFSQLMSMIEKGKADAIIVYNATRLARNAQDGGWLIYQLSIGNLKAIITPEKTYYNNGDDKFMLHIHFAMAEKTSDDTSSYVKRDIQGKLDRKEVPNKVCAGYLNIDKEGRISGKAFDRVKMDMLFKLKRPLKRTEIDPIEGPLWRQLGFEIIEERYTLGEAWKRALELGIKGRDFGRPVSKPVISSTFQNPLMYGYIRNIRGIYEGDFEHLFTKKQYDEINAILGNTERPVYRDNLFNRYNGLIFCGECGRQWTTEPPKKKQGYVYLRCSKSRKDYKCSQHYLALNKFEEQVEKLLANIKLSPKLIDWCIEEMRKMNDREFSGNDDMRKALHAKINDINDRLSVLLKKWSSPNNANGELMSDESYREEKEKLQNELATLKEQVDSVQQIRDNFYEDAERFFYEARDFAQMFKINPEDPELKRRILVKVSSNFWIKDKEVYIDFNNRYINLVNIQNSLKDENGYFEPQNMQEVYSKVASDDGLRKSLLGN